MLSGHYFVSYSRNDGVDTAIALVDQLAAGRPSYPLWVDVRKLSAGQQDWDDQIAEAIQTCRGLLFVMTADSARAGSGCKDEWDWALKYKKPVIPLRMRSDVGLPFRLQARQYVDFSDSFDGGLARLRLYLAEADTPKGELRELRFRLGDAERELPRASGPGARTRIEQDIADIRLQISAQEALISDPAAAVAAADERIAADIEVERQPQRPQRVELVSRARFVNAPPMTAPTYFQDRQPETEVLAEALRSTDTRLVTVVGRGGIGKTALVCRLLKALESGRLPDGLGELAVAGIVYLRTPSMHPVNFPNLFTDLCRLLPGGISERLLARYREARESPGELMLTLLDAFPAEPVVVLLDNFEDLLDADTGTIADADLDEALRTLLSVPAHGVKVVLTTRVAPGPLLLHEPGVQRRIDLDGGLPSPYAENLLRARDPDGRLGLLTSSEAQLTLARERTRGYPRALEALAAILSADRNTSLSELLAETERLPGNVVQALVGEAFQRLDPLAQQIMQALAIFPASVPAVAVDYLLRPYQQAIDAAPVLGRLVNMQFARRNAGHYYLHQVDRDYALSLIPEGDSDHRRGTEGENAAPFTQQALRERAADYFARVERPRAEWKTLDDLAPQLAQFELRYQNGDYDAAARMLSAISFDYLFQWGHYRYTIELYARLQDRLAESWNKASSHLSLGNCHNMLGQVHRAIDHYEHVLAIYRELRFRPGQASALHGLGNCYADLGQTTAAIEHFGQALAIYREFGIRHGEAAVLSNLGNCHADLGQSTAAIEHYKQALVIKRTLGDHSSEAISLICLADCYADLGQLSQAVRLCERALTIVRGAGERSSEALTLVNLGYYYTDLEQIVSATEHYDQGIAIGDEIGFAQAQAEGRLGQACAQLYAGDLTAAAQILDAAREVPFPLARAGIVLLAGIIQLRQGNTDRASKDLRDALTAVQERLRHSPDDYAAFDIRGLAYTALTIIGADHSSDAIAAFRAARARTTAAGIVSRVLRDLNALAPVDPTGALEPIRRAAAGEDQ
ncbi:MAG TPA: tetratricopeptide repeat protein [Jatrophihabitans sp.]|nr:tetratricopeptide repeat protein [Jatrophihabitans sp.]